MYQPLRTSLLFVSLLLSHLAFAGELKVQIGDAVVVFAGEKLNHEVVPTDRGKGDQSSALQCSLLYYGLLADGAFDKAAALTTDPAGTAQKWEQIKQRMGEEALNKQAAAYFTSA